MMIHQAASLAVINTLRTLNWQRLPIFDAICEFSVFTEKQQDDPCQRKQERKFASVIPTSQIAYLRSTPPSSEALRHSGGDNRLCTSATVTLYFEVLLRRDRRPGTEQNTSPGEVIPEITKSLLLSFFGLIPKERIIKIQSILAELYLDLLLVTFRINFETT